jgi:hypothetical protein
MIESTVLNLATPGVYTQELNAFPPSVVAVATAVPAFVGYTPRADYKGKSLLGKPRKISSLADFYTYFGAMEQSPGSSPSPASVNGQYNPVYYLSLSAGSGDLNIGGKLYDLVPDAGTIFYLYNSIRLFYANGGGDAYVVSVGNYGKPVGKPRWASRSRPARSSSIPTSSSRSFSRPSPRSKTRPSPPCSSSPMRI